MYENTPQDLTRRNLLYPIDFIIKIDEDLRAAMRDYAEINGIPDVFMEAVEYYAGFSVLIDQYDHPEGFLPKVLEGFNEEIRIMVPQAAWLIDDLEAQTMEKRTEKRGTGSEEASGLPRTR